MRLPWTLPLLLEQLEQIETICFHFEEDLKADGSSRSSIEDRVTEFNERFGGGLTSFMDIPSRLRDAAERIEEFSERMKKKDD